MARNSFVGRAQTGSQFTRETKKGTNKNGVALSSGLIFCAGLLKAACKQSSLTWFCQEELKTTGT